MTQLTCDAPEGRNTHIMIPTLTSFNIIHNVYIYIYNHHLTECLKTVAVMTYCVFG